MFQEKDSYGNEVSRLARPLPVEYLLVDVPASTPLTPQFTFTADTSIRSFPVENRLIYGHTQDFAALSSYMSQFSPDQFLKAVSDFHLLLYIATMDVLPMRVQQECSILLLNFCFENCLNICGILNILQKYMVPLLQAVREQDSQKAIEWSQSDQWATVEQVMAASSGTTPHNRSSQPSDSFMDVSHTSPHVASWTCSHCTFMNPSNSFMCEICDFPREM